MNTINERIECSRCGKKLGVITLFGGTMNITSLAMCCLKCLPKRLEQLGKEGYSQSIIDDIRRWLKE